MQLAGAVGVVTGAGLLQPPPSLAKSAPMPDARLCLRLPSVNQLVFDVHGRLSRLHERLVARRTIPCADGFLAKRRCRTSAWLNPLATAQRAASFQ